MTEINPDSFKRHIYILAVSVSIVNTGFGIIFPIFPKLLVDVGGGTALDLAVLLATWATAFFISAPIFGNLADRFGKKRIILLGLFGFAVSNFIYIFATKLSHLFIARVAEGIFAAAILPPAIAMTADLSPKESRGKYLGIMGASSTSGIIIGPLIGGFLFEGFVFGEFSLQGSIRLPFYISAFFGFLAFVWSFFQLPSLHSDNSLDRILENSSLAKMSVFSRIGNTLRHQVRVLPKPLYMFFFFILSEMFSILAWLTIEPGFIFYFYDELLLSPIDFGLFVGAFAVINVLGQALLGNLSDKFGRKPVMIVGQLFSFLFYYSLLNAQTLSDLIFAVIFVGIGSGLREPAMKAWLSDVIDDKHRSTVFGIEASLLSTSQIFGPLIGGYVYITQGMNYLFWIAIAINIANIFLIMTLWFNEIEVDTDLIFNEPTPDFTE